MKLKSLKLATLAALLTGHSHAALLLQSPVLGGNQETAAWESGSLAGPPSTGASAPTAGTGSISPISPGYRATAGYYAFTNHFGLTATTEAIGISDIRSVMFQRVSMANPGTEDHPLTPYDNLVWDGTNPYETGTDAPLITVGGPWLSYFDAEDNLIGRIQATSSAILGSVYDPDAFIPGTYYNFAYQWDLSGVAETIVSIRLDAPILVHSSTVEARFDISDNYVQVIPEPSSFLLGCVGFALILRRRR